MTWTPDEIATIIEETITDTTSDVTTLCALIHDVAEAVTGVVAMLHATGQLITPPTRALPSPLMQRLTTRLTAAAAVKQTAAANDDADNVAAYVPDDEPDDAA